MYERFTDRARQVMQLANQEAQRFNHEYIGTEHILLGLIREGPSVASNVLKNLDIDLRKVRSEVEKIVQSGPDMVQMGKLPQTPRAKKVIEFAIEEAKALHHDYVGTEHLLLGLLREEEGVASQVLMNLGLKLKDAREEVLNLLGHNMDSSEPVGRPEPVGPKPPGPVRTYALDTFGRDWTALARQGRLDPFVGRDVQLEQLVTVLGCRDRANPLLVGAPGAGKAALVRGLARWGTADSAPEALRGRRVVALNLAQVALGSGSRIQFEQHLRGIVHAAGRAGDVLLFLEDLFSWGGTAGTSVSFAGKLLQSLLAKGEVRCLAATTPDRYRASLAGDEGFARHFQPVPVLPATREEALSVLRALRDAHQVHHQVQIRDDALGAAVELSARYLPEECLPGKAVRVLDQAAALVGLRRGPRQPDVRGLEEQIGRLEREKEASVAGQDFEKAAHLRDQADRLKAERERALGEWLTREAAHPAVVGPETVAEVVRRTSEGMRRHD